jgi:glycosyltransferase involved in cell wall biosynthesis
MAGARLDSESRPWNDHVDRVVIHTPMYLTYDGQVSTGGRERHIRDLARLVQSEWGRRVVIVQMANRSFETTCPDGFEVVGHRAYTKNALGEPPFAWWLQHRFARRRDGVLYAASDHAFPFFRPGSKGVQHGIWWDGPLSPAKRWMQSRRILTFVQQMRSVLCVDTNLVNWLRGHGAVGLRLTERCQYVPNYADLQRLPVTERGPGRPLRLLYARRFHASRGPWLFLDALALLRRRGVDFAASLYTVGGEKELRDAAFARGLEDRVTVAHASLDEILDRYAEADVSVVPTLWSEGTSFSAVESVCAGVPVVATPVGGLGNLIIPDFNGQIVAPTPAALADGIAHLADEATWRRLRAGCLAMREALSMERWNREVLAWLQA